MTEQSRNEQETATVSSLTATKRSRPVLDDELQALIFPKRLMAILGNKKYHNSVAWAPDGLSFFIVDKATFVEDVMPKFSPRKSKFSSFLRKLNRW